MNEDRLFDLREVLGYAWGVIQDIKDGREIVHEGAGFGEVGSDIEIHADAEIGRLLLEYFSSGPFSSIDIEGRETVYKHVSDTAIHGFTPVRRLYIDPLDGSLNYRRSNGSVSLPYSTVIAEFAQWPMAATNPKFSDCRVAGVVDLRTCDMWTAHLRNFTELNGQRVRTSGMTTVDKALGTTIIGEFYYPDNRERLVRAFEDFRGYLRNPGSAGYELALVASGQVDAFVCDQQKCDVLGAGYQLVTHAGGFVCDFDGKELGSMPYDFNAQQSVVAAATFELADEIVERLNR